MTEEVPKLIRINHDDYHAQHVGQTADGRQFFLTNPFIPKLGGDEGREFIALYIFDAEGNFLEAQIDDLGTRESSILPGQKLEIDAVGDLVTKRLEKLGEYSFTDIEIAPFCVEHYGTEFGLITHAPEEEDDDWYVTVEPGDYMCFYPPWDGNYDT